MTHLNNHLWELQIRLPREDTQCILTTQVLQAGNKSTFRLVDHMTCTNTCAPSCLKLYNLERLWCTDIYKVVLYTEFKYIRPVLFAIDVSAMFKVTWHKNQEKYYKSGPSNLDIVPSFKNQWSIASSHCKWLKRLLFKMARFPTVRPRWMHLYRGPLLLHHHSALR